MAAEAPHIDVILLLDSDGKRIYGKYSGEKYATAEQQSEFEKNLYSKTKNTHARTEAEIILLNKQIIVYMFSTDVYLYVGGDHNENELILATMLSALYDTLDTMLRHQVDHRNIMDNLGIVLMTLDELVDNGVIMEHDSSVIVSHVSSRDGGLGGGGGASRAMGGSSSSGMAGGGGSSSMASMFASATRSLLKQ
eukprot:SAG22_NODE_203_length_15320_cov_14.023516_1_plen_194_part_00